MKLDSFIQALLSLGKTDDERARALGVSRATFSEYKSGRLPRQITKLLSHPDLLQALVTDTKAAAQPEQAAA